MAYRLNRLLVLPLRPDLAKNARTTWSKCRLYCTCFIPQGQNEPKQCEPNRRNYLVKRRGFILTFKRSQQTLSNEFGAHIPSLKQMEHFLSARKIQFEHGHTSLIASCPFCAKKEDGVEKPKALTLYINKTTGSHFCKNCGSAGTWQKFKVRLTIWYVYSDYSFIAEYTPIKVGTSTGSFFRVQVRIRVEVQLLK